MKEHPPLDGNLFERAACYRPSPLLRRVEAQARTLGEASLCSANPSVSLEAHLGRLYFEMDHNPLRVSAQSYFEAVDLYAHEIIATTNWMMGKSGLIKKVIQSELRASRQVSVVTFNIDLLAENALNLLTTARPGALWYLNHAYGFSTPKDPVVMTSPSYSDTFDYAGTGAEIQLCKMHGSTNWVFQHRDRYPPADLVSKRRELYVVTRRMSGSSWNFVGDLRG